MLAALPGLHAVDFASLENVFDSLNDVVFFVKDREGRYACVNNTLVRRVGLRTKAQIRGKTVLEVYPRPL